MNNNKSTIIIQDRGDNGKKWVYLKAMLSYI